MYFDKSNDNEWKTIEHDKLERIKTIKTKKDGKTCINTETHDFDEPTACGHPFAGQNTQQTSVSKKA